jgi:hypothetical protein
MHGQSGDEGAYPNQVHSPHLTDAGFSTLPKSAVSFGKEEYLV